jgi:hypothetical protein
MSFALKVPKDYRPWVRAAMAQGWTLSQGRMPIELRDAIKAKAETEQRSMAGAIRWVLTLYVKGEFDGDV